MKAVIQEGRDLAEDSAQDSQLGDGMLRPNHGTLRLPNEDDDDNDYDDDDEL